MGNMGNPLITRLGINQFWYKSWYSDKFFSANLHQDNLFEVLLKLYLNYGLTFSTNPFWNDYWYNKSTSKGFTPTHIKNINFFRRFFYTNDVLNIEHSYLLRNRTGEYFPLRLWLLKHNNWVILSVKWFKPQKTKNLSNFRDYSPSYVKSIHVSGRDSVGANRLKLVMLFFLLKLNSLKKEYAF